MRYKQKLLPLLVLVALLAGGFSQSGKADNPAPPREIDAPTGTITVCPTPFACDYTTITAAIAAAQNGDTIQVSGDVYEEHLTIDKDISLVGVGPQDTILQPDEGITRDIGRLITVTQSAAVSIEGITIRHGSAYTTSFYGGGILVRGALTLTNSVVRKNESLLDGGGIYITATAGTTASLTLIQSRVEANNANEHGGGIAVASAPGNVAVVNIISSTIITNTTDGRGGGMALAGDLNSAVTLAMTNTTMGDNRGEQSGGAIYMDVAGDGSARIVQSTIYDNHSQIGKSIHVVNGNLTLLQSILAGGKGGNSCQNDGATITDSGFNLIDDGSCNFPTGGNPLLDSAGASGYVQFYKPRPGSPVLDTTPFDECATQVDQRGRARPFGIGCDTGSIELDEISLALYQVTTPNPGGLRPEQYITTTVHIVPQGPGLTHGVLTATIPSQFILQGPPVLDPPGSGTLGTPPVLVQDITIPTGSQLTVTLYAQVAWGVPGQTHLLQAFAFTSTEIVTQVVTTQTLTVINVPPVARDDGGALGDEFTTMSYQAFVTGNVLNNDTDSNGDTIIYNGVDTTGLIGILTYNGDGTFTYDPAERFDTYPPGAILQDTFVYTIEDGRGGLDTATVIITIRREDRSVYLPLVIR